MSKEIVDYTAGSSEEPSASLTSAERTTDDNAATVLRVVVVDDEEFILTLVAALVESLGYEVVACSTAAAAVTAMAEFDPHVVITDLDLGPGPSGIDVLRNVARTRPWVATIVLSSHRSTKLVSNESFSLDPRTVYLVKSDVTSAQTVGQAIEAALAGERFVLLPRGETITLTGDQAEVVRLIAEGLTNAEIAERRGTKLRAVEALVRRTFDALGFADLDVAQARLPAIRMFERSGIEVS